MASKMKSTFTPARIFIFVWAMPGLSIIGSLLGSSANGPKISYVAAVVCLIGMASVLAGCAGGYLMRVPIGSSVLICIRKRYKLSLALICILAAVGGVEAMSAWARLGINFSTLGGDALYAMNVAYADEGRLVSGFIGRLYALLPIMLFAGIYLRKTDNLSMPYFAILCIIAILLMVSPRRAMLIDAIGVAAMAHFAGKKLPFAKLLTFIACGLILFVLFFGYTQYKLGKIENFDLASIFGAILSYYNSSIYVMSSLIGTKHFEGVWIIFNPVGRILNAVLDEGISVDLSVPFVFTPEPSNTLPAFYYFYKSGGFVCVVVASFLIGYVATAALKVYEKTGSYFSCAIYSLMTIGLALSIRECLFITYDFWYWVIAHFASSLLLTRASKLR